jgi:2-polyprenyl-6-methoxyphenol hydroxylase-like FAD-dependent oxidoreductase
MALNFGGNGFFGYCFAETSEEAPNREIPQGELPPGNNVMWWSTYEVAECPDPKSVDKEAILRDLRERHGKWRNPVIQKIISKAQVQTMWPVWTTPQLPTWEKDGLVLIGDAAHALPPTSGQGSSQALEDAECLALLLAHFLGQTYGTSEPQVDAVTSDKDAIRAAAKKFMAIRQPRIKAILDISRQFESKKRHLTWIEEWLLYLGLFIAGRFPAPSWLTGMFSYNIADEVSRVITTEMTAGSSGMQT